MPSFKVTVTKIDAHPDGVSGPNETEIFRQTVEEMNLAKFVLALNKPPRTRKTTKAGKPGA